ncbi:hypothetical protein [Labedaea rhizosphaerae]|uniref:Uncharacterized protein n=1 Tax=Labedaea rhizosphaerae TaxID=598644 RepID=A0A4R6SN14_LABRH|nr:hypothetical protein [Labedaea rhizosphaerae]TDQ04762.1 hypothetical protein EV186_101719 [Labedaea rhizosphaerae]
MAVDARGYSRGSDQDQRELQRVLVASCDHAARAAGLDRATWAKQPAGDGEFAVLPVDEREDLVVDRYVRELSAELSRYNGRVAPDARLRLRLAVHFGRLAEAANGYAGPAPIVVGRMLDSAVLRQALIDSDADLAVLFSDQVYQDFIATLSTTVRPAHLRRVVVREKGFEADAWLWVPGHEAGDPMPESATASSPAAAPAGDPVVGTARSQVVNEFHGPVDARRANFGFELGVGR